MNPCWEGYTAIGMKRKNGRKVPNCVPEALSGLKGKGIFDYFKKGVSYVGDAVSNVASRFTVKMDYTNKVKKVLAEQGNKIVKAIELYRYPVQAYYPVLLDILTLGKFSKAKNELRYDKMFHLGMIITLEDETKLLIEKNAVIDMTTDISEPSNNPKTQRLQVPIQNQGLVPPFTLNEMLDRAKLKMGEKDYFTYEALSTNCQNYIKNLLEASNLYDAKENNFVFQDVEGISKQLPGISKKIISGILKTISIGHNVIGTGKEGGSQNSGYIQAIMAKKAGYPELDLTIMNKSSQDIASAKVEAFYRYVLQHGVVNERGLIPNIQRLYRDFLGQRVKVPDAPFLQPPIPAPAPAQRAIPLDRLCEAYYQANPSERPRLKREMEDEYGVIPTKRAMEKIRQRNSRANRRSK
jgi:hypothetical protein